MPELTVGPGMLRKRLESVIRQDNLSPAEATSARAELERRITNDRQKRVQEMLATREQGRQQYPGAAAVGKLTGPAFAFVSHLANSQYLGWVPEAAGAATAALGIGSGETFADRRDINTEKARTGMAFMGQANPASSTVGEIGGYVAPGPTSGLLKGVAAVGRGTVGKLAAKTVEGSLLKRAGAQMAANIATGSAGNAVLEGLDGDREGFVDRLKGAAGAAINPGAIAINGIGGAIAGTFRTRVSQAAMRAYESVKRIAPPGSVISPEVLRGETATGVELGRLFSNLSQLPGARGTRDSYMRKVFWEPFEREMDRVVGGLLGGVAREGASDVAGRAFQKLPERVDRVRKGIEGQALSRNADVRTPGFAERFFGIARDFVDDEVRHKGFSDLGGRMHKVLRGAGSRFLGTKNGVGPPRPEDIRALEEYRQMLGEVSALAKTNPDLVKNADQRLANQLYEATRQYMTMAAPEVDRALKAGKFLHELGKIVEPYKQLASQDGEHLVMQALQSRDSNAILKVFQRFSTETERQAARGFTAAQLFERVIGNQSGGMLLNRRTLLRELNNKSSPFYRRKLDQVMGGPQFREALEDISTAHDFILRGSGAPQNSATAGRTADFLAITGLANAANIIHGMIDNSTAREAIFRGLLGQVGTAALISSLQRGKLAQKLNDLASGHAVTSNPLYGALYDREGGVGGALQSAGNIASGALGTAAGAVSGYMGLGKKADELSGR